MDATIRWIIGTILFAQTAIIGFLARALWAHVVECRDVRRELGGIAENLTRIREDIGNHETGIRGWLHSQADRITEHAMRLEMLDHFSDKVKR